MNKLKFFKTHPDVNIPKFATEQSACFDLSYSSAGKNGYKGFDRKNAPIERNHMNGKIFINSGDRILVPTGLVLDIPEGYSVRIHPRSGLSLKQGLILANAEGVIDSDYVEELFLILTNDSENSHWINNGDRLAQGELVVKEKYVLEETTKKPERKSDRDGGMGSTGINKIDTSNLNVVAQSDQPVKRGRGRPKKVA